MVEQRSKDTVFVTGSTGYTGRRLIARLLERGHAVRALVSAIENASQGVRVIEVSEIRELGTRRNL